MVKNPDDALDVVQDSYISGFSKIKTLKSPEAFLSWMYRITANNCKKFFINSKDIISFENEDNNPIDNISEDNEGFLPQDAMENKETQKMIMNMVNNLPDEQRNCIMIYYFSEMSVSEIAEIMECSEGTIKSRLNYGRKQIKKSVLSLEEKENIKLYGFLPIGRIATLFQTIPNDTFSSVQGAENIWDGIVANTWKVGTTAVVVDIDGVSIKNLGQLSNLKDLKALGLQNGTIYDVSPLAGLDKLMAISIISSEQIEGQETFRQLPALQVLQVSDSQGMSLSSDEWEKRQMDIEGVEVDYNQFDRTVHERYREVMDNIYESINN